MVCQAETRTTFQALKHENGIAGSSTIIIRIIACFRPLQDCQVINTHILLMGQDNNPRINLQCPIWQFSYIISARDNRQFAIRRQNLNPVFFSTCVSPNACVLPVTFATPFPDFYARNFFHKASPLIPPLAPFHVTSKFDGSEKRYLVFDQLRDGRNFAFSSSSVPIPCMDSVNPGFDVQGSTEPSDWHGSEEIHENTEELDALLYSDSDDNHVVDEASTGSSPIEEVEKTISAVASSVLSVKRKRADDEFDASVTDTASSQVLHFPNISSDNRNKEDDNSASICFELVDDQIEETRQLKRTKIQETVGLLRKIIPGGNAMDAITVLDKAINYLKSLKLNVKSFETFP
ncbi:transcription factor bHLH145-like [Zingiber officinale]|nr:transcription factor bHLH145-like [Zingiber officinale]